MSSKSRRVPEELRQRTEHSCDRCKSRKQKCLRNPGETKCRHCQKYGYDCMVTKPRKQRLYGTIETHSIRLAILESLVKGLVPEADLKSIDNMKDIARSLGIPLSDSAAMVSAPSSHRRNDSVVAEAEEGEQLVHDLQGQGQYIGRASSYFFQMKLRNLVGRSPNRSPARMLMFNSNPASNTRHSERAYTITSEDEVLDISSIASSVVSPSADGHVGPGEAASADQNSVVYMLVRIFFKKVNVDFPVLHEATFLESLDSWAKSPTSVDDTWLCGLLCVLILARRHCHINIPQAQELAWWSRIQSLLSKVIFTSTLTSVQTLMLAALHLHNTNSRDICWTLIGTAIRIGYAIGLHRDDIDTKGTPLTREMRKRVWWTLYSFEQLQVSSHDRPSAINNPKHLPNAPREAILDIGTYNIPDYITWSNRLTQMLGTACCLLPEATKDGFFGPLSPAAGLMRELARWRTSLPAHLSMDSIDAMPPTFQRPLILLHVQYHYIVCLISRYALFSRFTTLSQHCNDAVPEQITSISDICIESGRLSCELLLRLDVLQNFNAVSWLDVYFLYSSSLVLVLSIICNMSQIRQDGALKSISLLHQCANLATKHLQNPLVPGTMSRWLVVVGELKIMVDEFSGSRRGQSDAPEEASSVEEATPEFNAFATQLTLEGSSLSSLGTEYEVDATMRRRGLGCGDILGGTGPSFVGSSASPIIGSDPLHSPNGGNLDSRLWAELHWEGISDMLLNMEPREFNM